jgi:hypothetical protein
MSALEAKNGFVTAENCFVGTPRRNIRRKMSIVFMMKGGTLAKLAVPAATDRRKTALVPSDRFEPRRDDQPQRRAG